MVSQSNAYLKPAVVSALLGSEGLVSDTLMLLPSSTSGELSVAVGAALEALQSKLSVVWPPFPSLTCTTTVPLPWSVGVCAQLHVPRVAPGVTVPSPETLLMVSVSLLSWSAKTPLVVSWEPSSPEASAAAVLTVGALLAGAGGAAVVNVQLLDWLPEVPES